jgi:hypothetical protein
MGKAIDKVLADLEELHWEHTELSHMVSEQYHLGARLLTGRDMQRIKQDQEILENKMDKLEARLVKLGHTWEDVADMPTCPF